MNGRSVQRRLFLGISLPPPMVSELETFSRRLTSYAGIRLIPGENLHITVYFFGSVPEEQLENLISLISLGLKTTQSFELVFDRYCFAPQSTQPRMIWARFRKSDVFRDLVGQIHALYQQISPLQQRKSPVPHITLARLKDFSDTSELNLARQKLPALRVNELVLWESVLRPEGAYYTAIRRFSLG
ncbi:MAG: RNA 2',3'-cyclic phosphodiesterase [Bacteroidia bacterium]